MANRRPKINNDLAIDTKAFALALIACTPILCSLFLGCGQKARGSVEMGFRNLSDRPVWVESARFSNADVGCGYLSPGLDFKELRIPRFETVPEVIEIEWWEDGNHVRPSSQEQILTQSVNLPDFSPDSPVWYVYFTLGDDGKWLAARRN